MKASRFEAAGLKCIEVAPDDAAGRDLPLFICMHGRGDRAESYVDLAPIISETEIRFVLPDAPLPVPGAYFEWFSIDNPNRVLAAQEARAMVTKLITELREKYQTPANRIILGGFSQGGMLAFEVGLRYSEPLAGLAVMSGMLLADVPLSPQPLRFTHYYEQDQGDLKAALAETATRQTPIFIAHGTYDAVIPVVAGRTANRILKEAGCNVEYYEFSGQHEISLEELEEVKQFLGKIIS
jgi:phospholipase/carboxylesterase